MATFIVSGSIDCGSPPTPSGPTYRVCATGSFSVGDTSRVPVVALTNLNTGSVDMSLRVARLHVGPRGATIQNEVCFALGSRATGMASGSPVAPTALDPTSPTSVALAYRTPTGLSLGPPMAGFLVRSQSASISNNTPIVIQDDDGPLAGRLPVIIPPGESYVISLSELIVIAGGTTVFTFAAEFEWDEVS